ncbi:beta-fructofuranosidase, insoluble isoenzyme CWINV1-like isoform X2 [Salvia miltiorrhiza]|uniref:beta-fructofuranosidase, insoluble isoenzyme CWINV1-like isoform X2 n=1 Tax=Salvia miltiorrhiza TaxID=226208 RepID=UPI0025AC6ADD|nr:beta-fructofuranosidase, insoluble isoenzyme CWINV1-like isoform X2 [Salvia miltiorrhiza]
MEKYVIWVVLLQAILIGYAIKTGYFEENRNIIEEFDEAKEKQPYRTGFHFQPPKNWMNGPMYYNGVYHFFYQYNPYGATWGNGNLSWAHSVSYNLVDWTHIEHALSPSEPYDLRGCWSGSVTILPDNNMPVIFYTSISVEGEEVQNLAMPRDTSDPFLREWVKSRHNPLIRPPSDIDPRSFRDPTTAWQKMDKTWCVLIGSQLGSDRAGILYTSRDFISWSRGDNPLHMSNRTGMWECPDFYPVSASGGDGLDTSANGEDVLHVLKASFSGRDDYVIGTYDPMTDEFNVVGVDFMDDRVQLRYDYGNFYASKSFYDAAKKRRVLWSWVLEGDSEANSIARGWYGLQALPRTILLHEDHTQLIQWPIEEVEGLRDGKVTLDIKEIESGTMLEIAGITASQADVEVSFHVSNLDGVELIDEGLLDPQLICTQNNASVNGVLGPFGLLVLASEDLTEQTAIFFRIFKGRGKHVVLMCSDQSRSSLKTPVKDAIYGSFLDIDPNKEISLRTLIDHSIIESFGGKGKACITARAYPTLAVFENSHIYVFNNGAKSIGVSSLSAWSMKNAQFSQEGSSWLGFE